MKEPTLSSTIGNGACGKLMAGLGALVFVLLLVVPQAYAVKFNTGNEDFRARWDNTVTYSAIDRLGDQDSDLISDPNTDDGDRNFDKGLVMNRFDLLSEADIVYKKFGVRVSGAAWYDFVYNETNDNNSPKTANAVSVPYNHFTRKTRDLHGRYAELLEAFTWGAVDLGDTTFRYRAGQFSQWWGDTFFLGWNGVAGALAPVDVAKAATLPNTQLKELIRPIPQISGSLQILDNMSVDAYYQFTWQPARLFASGSYFSPADLIGPGAERIIAGLDNTGPFNFLRSADRRARDDGQFGIKASYQTMLVDFGLYYNRFHAKDFYVVTALSPLIMGGAPVIGGDGHPVSVPNNYYLYYAEDIDQYSASANMAFGELTYSAEVTYRTNVPLQTRNDVPGMGSLIINGVPGLDTPHFAKGDTLGVTANIFAGGMRGNFFCDSQDLIAEVAAVKTVSEDQKDLLAPGYSRYGLGAKVVYTPKWYQALPGLDLTLPMGIEYAFKGKPSTLLWGMSYDEGGDFNIGVGGTYNAVWDFELTYRNYFGETDMTKINYQANADRDYISFYIRRSF